MSSRLLGHFREDAVLSRCLSKYILSWKGYSEFSQHITLTRQGFGLKCFSRVTLEGVQYVVDGDVIVSISGTRIINTGALSTYSEEHTTAGQSFSVGIVRAGAPTTANMVLGSRPLHPRAIACRDKRREKSLRFRSNPRRRVKGRSGLLPRRVPAERSESGVHD